MLLYTKKMLPYNIINILCLLLGNILFLFSFALLFNSAEYSLNYYAWLKYIDIFSCVFLLVNIVLGSILLIPQYLLNPPKQKKVLHTIFSIIQVYIVILAFFNLISFYTGAIHILIILAISFMILAQVVMLISNIAVEKDMLFDGYDKEYFKDVRVFDKQNKVVLKTNITQLTPSSIVINKKTLISAILSIICYLFILVVYIAWIFQFELSINQIVIYIFLGSVIILFLMLLLGFLLIQYKCSLKFLYINRWVPVVLLCVNIILSCGIVAILYFAISVQISIYILMPVVVMLCLINYLLLSIIYTNKTLYSKILK